MTNTLLVATFTLVVGILIVVIGGLSFKLHDVIGDRMEFDKKQSIRMPEIDDATQSVHFAYARILRQDEFDKDEHYRHLQGYIEGSKKKKDALKL